MLSDLTNHPTIGPDKAAEVISALARGYGIQRAADRTRVPVATVKQLAAQHGYPDLGKLAVASEQLRAQNRIPTLPSATVQVSAAEAPANANAPLELEQVIAEARSLGGRLKTLANRADDAVQKLLAGMDEHSETARQQKAAREKVARLEKQLAAAKAELSGVAQAAKRVGPRREFPEGACDAGHDLTVKGVFAKNGNCIACLHMSQAAARAASMAARTQGEAS